MPEKILIAGMHDAYGDRLAENLRAIGAEIVFAHDATQLVSLAREHVPALVVLNAHHARWTVAALRSIRSNASTAHVPVLAILSEGGQSEEEFTSAGAQVCARQPLSDAALYESARRCLEIALNVTQAPGAILHNAQRMADLEETEWLDSAPSEKFDRLTRLASRMIDAPASLMSLVDRNRQFFKSQIGVGEPWASRRQTPLSHSFCQWVVSSGEPLVVEDAREHPVLKNNLAVSDLGVVAYAGVPLLGRHSQPIGSFCIVDVKPHGWTQSDMELLQDLAATINALAVSKAARVPEANDKWPPDWVRLIGESICGASRILRRYGERIHAQDKKDLLDIIDEQTVLLLEPRSVG